MSKIDGRDCLFVAAVENCGPATEHEPLLTLLLTFAPNKSIFNYLASIQFDIPNVLIITYCLLTS